MSHQATLQPIVDKLTRLKALSDAECSAILALPYLAASVERGCYLVREGDKVRTCCALLSGFLYRQKSTGDGARQILAVNMKGDLVDLQNSLLGVADHNVQALTDAQVAYIPVDAILSLIAGEPGISQALWMDTLIDGSIGREWLLSTGQRSARQRIAHFFCELALREGVVTAPSSDHYSLPLNQEEIGDVTGMTAVHANRTIQGLRKDGIIEISSHVLTVIDWPALQAAGDFNGLYLHQKVRPASSH